MNSCILLFHSSTGSFLNISCFASYFRLSWIENGMINIFVRLCLYLLPANTRCVRPASYRRFLLNSTRYLSNISKTRFWTCLENIRIKFSELSHSSGEDWNFVPTKFIRSCFNACGGFMIRFFVANIWNFFHTLRVSMVRFGNMRQVSSERTITSRKQEARRISTVSNSILVLSFRNPFQSENGSCLQDKLARKLLQLHHTIQPSFYVPTVQSQLDQFHQAS